jgi:hypothetical protein
MKNPNASQDALRPWWPWLVTALAFPPAGYLAYIIVGAVDSIETALAEGMIAGAVIGTVQWLFLRRRSVPATWVAGTAAGMAVGLMAGSAIVSYDTSLGALAVMGLVSGIAVGIGQALSFHPLRHRALEWSLGTGVLWAIGWAITTAAGINVDEQWAVFGISGALVVALLQSFVVGRAAPSVAASGA